MKQKLCIACMLLFSIVKAQTVTPIHYFPGETKISLSVKKGSVAWIDTSGGYYTHNEMDTLMNITSVMHNDLPTGNNAPFTIPSNIPGNNVWALNSIYDKSGTLWGLFFNSSVYADSLNIDFNYIGNGCFFLYNFYTNQRFNFYFQNTVSLSSYLTPFEAGFISNLIMHGDTLVTTMSNPYYNISTGSGTICTNLKFLNGNLMNRSNAFLFPSLNFLAGNHRYCTTFIDEYDIENIVYYDDFQFFQKADYIHYTEPAIQQNFDYIQGSFLLDSLNRLVRFFDSGTNDSLCIRDAGIETKIAVPMNDSNALFNERAALCTDHANRYWVVRDSSLQMYDGVSWVNIPSNMKPFQYSGSGVIYIWISRVFAEIGNNQFVIGNYTSDSYIGQYNGFYYFTYNPLSVSIEAKQIETPKFYYNTAESKLTVWNTGKLSNFYLYDITGKELKQMSNKDEVFILNTQHLSKGVYVLKGINKEQQAKSIKFIVE